MAKPIRHGNKWRLRWIDHEGVRKSAVRETYKDAEFEQRKNEVEAEEIRRGVRLPSSLTKRTVGDLCDYWIEKRTVNKRSKHDAESIIRKHLRPAFGQVRLRELSIAHVDTFCAERAHLSPKTVNNHLTLLKSMLNLAHKLAWIDRVPPFDKPAVSLCDADYRYLRTQEELHRFLDAAEAEGEMVGVLYATAAYTGMRAGELAGLLWTDIDFDTGLITVQRSFEGPTKSNKVRHIPIQDALEPILRRWRLRHPGVRVFTNRDGGMLGPSGRVFQEVLHRVLERAGFPVEHTPKGVRRYITFHGLRHTFASHWVMCRGDLFRLQKVLGHSDIKLTMRYAHLAPDAFAADRGLLGPARGLGTVTRLRHDAAVPTGGSGTADEQGQAT